MTEIAAPARGSATLDIGRCLKRLFGVLRGRGVVLLLLGLLTIGVANSVFVALRHAGVLVPPPGELGAFRGAPGENFAIWLVTAAFYGGAVAAAFSWFRDKPFSLGDGFAASGRHFGRMLGISFLSNLAIVIGLILFIVPGVLLWVRWYAAQAVTVAENRGVTDSMGRAAKLSENCRFAIFVVGLVAFVMAIVAAFLIGLLLFAVNSAVGNEQVGDYVGEFFGVFLLAVFDAAAKAVVYDELIQAKEGGGQEQLSEIFA